MALPFSVGERRQMRLPFQLPLTIDIPEVGGEEGVLELDVGEIRGDHLHNIAKDRVDKVDEEGRYQLFDCCHEDLNALQAFEGNWMTHLVKGNVAFNAKLDLRQRFDAFEARLFDGFEVHLQLTELRISLSNSEHTFSANCLRRVALMFIAVSI